MSSSVTITPTAWVYDNDEWLPLLIAIIIVCVIIMIVCFICLCCQCCACSETHYYRSNELSKRLDNSPRTIENNGDPASDSYADSY